jgi:predicted permease
LRDRLVSFLISQAVVWLPMALGHGLRRREWPVERLAKPIHATCVIGLAPVIYVLGVWGLDRSNDAWWQVPLAYGLLSVVTTVIAGVVSLRMFRDRRAAATHFLSITISNIGYTLAGFLTILLLGQAAFPLNTVLMLPSSVFNFLIWLPLATLMAHGRERSLAREYVRLIFSPVSMPLAGILVGMTLNFYGPPMGAAWKPALNALVFSTTALTMFGIGCRLRARQGLKFRRTTRWLSLIKFVACPAIAVALCWALGLHGMAAGVVLIASAMPSGVMSIQFSTIQDLDVDLANAGFLLTTATFMIVVLPFLILALQAPMFR